MTDPHSQISKTIYGPIKSWRFGWSVGVDLLFQTSICSFNCIYCQLGNIQKHTTQREIYVPTEQVLRDFDDFLSENKPFDVITYSGSGEPTLALNLGETASLLKDKIPQETSLQILTNATTLHDQSVREDLLLFDRVTIKLDAPNQNILNIINRPSDNISFNSIVQGILEFKSIYKGTVDIQMMFLPLNASHLEDYIDFLKRIQPDTVQLNTPSRPYPMLWDRANRGNHTPTREYDYRTLSVISETEALQIENYIREHTNLDIVSIYR